MLYWEGRGGSNQIQQFSLREQLMITLMRLHRGDNLRDLTHRYMCSEFVIRQIFTTWIRLLFHHFKLYLILPHPDDLHRPAVFKPFPSGRASIDCTEFRCESSRDYARQGNLYSNYKHHTTMKCLIAVTPHGAAGFVSDLFEGSIDDVAIFKECGLMDQIDAGDQYLVDRGFTVQYLLSTKGASIFIPPFTNKEGKLNKEQQSRHQGLPKQEFMRNDLIRDSRNFA